ncbi:tetraspanin E118 [Danaus plexippus plexippus]|uniref:Tetraspanin E118 n=1 Tax=Danaus plexippus plexippus TaxID=278856 RepID=A0A212FKK6_DANPL|nr:tetraspanin E118 [Danaus plexippus plexippus]
MIALAAAKLYVVVVVFRNLSDIKDLVKEWLEEAFLRLEIREQFYVMQSTFQCCGTTGPNSYNVALPPSCCPSVVQTCEASSAFEGCNKVVADFFETYGEVIGIIVAVIVAIEVLAVVLSFSFCSTVGSNRRRTV